MESKPHHDLHQLRSTPILTPTAAQIAKKRPSAFTLWYILTEAHRGYSTLRIQHGIEVGHAFHLGTKYSETFNCRFTARDGADTLAEMGCYGLGLTRILAAIVCVRALLRLMYLRRISKTVGYVTSFHVSATNIFTLFLRVTVIDCILFANCLLPLDFVVYCFQ